MPSISKVALDEMAEKRARAESQAQIERMNAMSLRSRLAAFDVVLDKIVRAALGVPLDGDHMNSYGSYSSVGQVDVRLTDAEKQANVLAGLHERVVGLESRLAAVVAVAQFAKAHKA